MSLSHGDTFCKIWITIWKATRVSRPWQTNRGAPNTTRSWVGPTDFLFHLQKWRICCCSIVGRVLSLVFKLLSNCHFSFPSVVFPLAHVRLCAAPTGTSQSRFSPVLVFRQPAYGGARRPRCLCCGRRLCFCSIIGWGGKWKALRSCSPLFLSSCVLTFSPSRPLPAEPHTESARAVRPRLGRISQLSRGPRPRAGGGPPSPHHSQSKCHLLLTCKTLTIAPLGAAIRSSGGKEY